MANLFEQQARQLLIEIEQIISEKWPLAVQTGHVHLKTIVDAYRAVFESKDDIEIEDSNLNDSATATDRNFYVNQLGTLSTCNQAYDRLRDNLVGLDSLVSRLVIIQKNLNSLINMNVDLFGCGVDVANMEEFRTNMGQVVDSIKAELRLKKQIVEKFLFRARIDHASQVAIISMWIHEPYLSEPLVAKFISTIKFYSNKP